MNGPGERTIPPAQGENRGNLSRLRRGEAGVSLVELMIGMTIGLFLLAGVVKVFSSSKNTFRLNEQLSQQQNSARFALDVMTREVRMAGYMGCTSGVTIHNVLDPTDPDYAGWAMDWGNAISGYDQSQAGAFPAFGTAPLAGSDAIVVMAMDPDAFTIESHNPPSAQFKLRQSHDLLDDEVVMVVDCAQREGAIFQITNANQHNVTIVHNTGTGTIGNTTKCLRAPLDGNPCANGYGPNAVLARFRAVAFFVGAGASGEPALFMQELNGFANSAQELVEGVENMQILYGRDSDGDRVANQYLTAAAVSAASGWGDVVSVRVGLLMRSGDRVRTGTDTTTYSVAGVDIGTGTAVSHPADRRLRHVITTTIHLRNRI